MNNTFKVVSSIAVISLVAKFFGAGRELVLSYFFGSSNLTDAYILATTIPVTIFSFIYESIASGFIPICSKLKDEVSRSLFTSKVLNCLLIVTFAVIILIELFPEFIIKLFASGFDSNSLKISIDILRISIVGVIFTMISYVFVAYLNFNKSFLVPTARAIPLDIVVIISIVLGYYYKSIIILALGIPLSLVVSNLVLLPELKKNGYRYTFSFDFNDTNVSKLFKYSVPVILSTALFDINSIVDRQFASYLCVGGISVITYSSRLISIFTSLLIAPLLTFMFPSFTKDIQGGKHEEANHLYVKIIKILLLISIPSVLLIVLMSSEIVDLVFKRGAFGDKDAVLTSECLFFYSFSILAYAITSLATKYFYAGADMWTPMKVSFLGVVVNIIGNILLTSLLGLKGLALTNSISLLLVAIILNVVLIRKRAIVLKGITFYVCKVVISTSFGGIIIYLTKHMIFESLGTIIGCIISSLIFILSFYMSANVLKIPEIKVINNIVK